MPAEASAQSKPAEAITLAKPAEASAQSKPAKASALSKPAEASAQSKPAEASALSKPAKASALSKPAEASDLPAAAAASTVTQEGGQKPAMQLKHQEPSESGESSDDEEMESGKIHIKTAATIVFGFSDFFFLNIWIWISGFPIDLVGPDQWKTQTDPQSWNMVGMERVKTVKQIKERKSWVNVFHVFIQGIVLNNFSFNLRVKF